MEKSSKKKLPNHKKVIDLRCAEPSGWRFWDFSANDRDAIDDWYDGLSEDARYLFDSILKHNRKVGSPIQWIGFKRFMKGALKGSGIWELEFFSAVQHRVLGFFGPGRKEATLLVGCYHKQGVYVPPNALETAVRRKKMLERGEATHRERKITTDL
jgi:hypothetical protein